MCAQLLLMKVAVLKHIKVSSAVARLKQWSQLGVSGGGRTGQEYGAFSEYQI